MKTVIMIFLIVTILGVYYSEAVIDNLVVMRFNFNESSGSVYSDTSGYGNHLSSFSNVTMGVSGRDAQAGNCVSFNGASNSYIDCAQPAGLAGIVPAANSSYTVCYWFYLEAEAVNKYINHWGHYQGTRTMSNLLRSSADVMIWQRYAGDWATPYAVIDTAWTFVAYTYDAGAGVLYINGNSVGTNSFVGESALTREHFAFTAVPQMHSGAIGLIDDCIVYNGALTAGEVSEVFTTRPFDPPAPAPSAHKHKAIINFTD